MSGESHPHAHEPNLVTPQGDGSLQLLHGAFDRRLTPAELASLPQVEVEGCTIVSTGHGISGPFCFGGVRLVDLLAWAGVEAHGYAAVEAISADGFGVRLRRDEVESADPERPPLLALRQDGLPMHREQGLVRLIVPDDHDDALRQIKWLARLLVR